MANAPAQALPGLILDLDGTLLDTAPDFAAAANQMRAQSGLAPLPTARYATFIGQGMSVFVRRALADDFNAAVAPVLHEQSLAVFMAHYARCNGQAARLYPGVQDALTQWQALGWPMACVTNKPQALAQPLLQRFGLLDYFQVVVGGDALPYKKPHPAPMLHAAAALGLAPSAVWAIGDSQHDSAAARAAGMRVVLVTYGYNEGQSLQGLAAEAVVASLTQVTPLLSTMSGHD